MSRRRGYKRDRRGRFARTGSSPAQRRVNRRGSSGRAAAFGEGLGFVAGAVLGKSMTSAAVGAMVGHKAGRTVDALVQERRALKGRRA